MSSSDLHPTRRDPIYFTLVRLSDGDLASLTIIRKPQEFVAQLRSYGFTKIVSAPTSDANALTTDDFLYSVATAIEAEWGYTYTYEIPEGMIWTEWLEALERAHDPRRRSWSATVPSLTAR